MGQLSAFFGAADKKIRRFRDKPLPTLVELQSASSESYETVLGYIDEAIKALELEPRETERKTRPVKRGSKSVHEADPRDSSSISNAFLLFEHQSWYLRRRRRMNIPVDNYIYYVTAPPIVEFCESMTAADD